MAAVKTSTQAAVKVAAMRAWPWFVVLCALPGLGLWHLSETSRTLWLSLYGLSSVLSVGLYWLDKRYAQKGRARIAERTLLWVDALGGWVGGWWAQRLFRHKTAKRSFIRRFAFCVFLHQLLWAIYLAFISPLHDALFNVLSA